LQRLRLQRFLVAAFFLYGGTRSYFFYLRAHAGVTSSLSGLEWAEVAPSTAQEHAAVEQTP